MVLRVGDKDVSVGVYVDAPGGVQKRQRGRASISCITGPTGSGHGEHKSAVHCEDVTSSGIDKKELPGSVHKYIGWPAQAGSRCRRAVSQEDRGAVSNGRCDDACGQVHLPDSTVEGIPDIKLAVVHDHPSGVAQAGGCCLDIVSSKTGCPVSGHGGNDPGAQVDPADSVIVLVGNVEISTCDEHIAGHIQAGAQGQATVASIATSGKVPRSKSVPGHGGDYPRGQIHFADHMIALVGNVEVIPIQTHALRKPQGR